MFVIQECILCPRLPITDLHKFKCGHSAHIECLILLKNKKDRYGDNKKGCPRCIFTDRCDKYTKREETKAKAGCFQRIINCFVKR